jgi:hypothetical protein
MHPGFIDGNLKKPSARARPVLKCRQMEECLQRCFRYRLLRIRRDS